MLIYFENRIVDPLVRVEAIAWEEVLDTLMNIEFIFPKIPGIRHLTF